MIYGLPADHRLIVDPDPIPDGYEVVTWVRVVRRSSIVEQGPPCPRCGDPMHKVAVPFQSGDASWKWGHDCEPD